MAFTREFIRKAAKDSGVEIPKELEDALVQEHISARDAFANVEVKKALDENKPADPVKVKDSEEYKALKKEYDDYKEEQGKKESRAAKEAACRALLKEAGVSEKRIETVLKVYDVDGVELDGKGAIKDAKDRTKAIKEEWADFIQTTTTTGANPANPPANNGGSTKTKEEIMNIKDAGERQKAIMENRSLFGI